MDGYPKTVHEFEEWFLSEKACREYLINIRWPMGFQCPRCGHDKSWTTRRGLYRCAHCDVQISVTAGTIFQDTRKPLRTWFHAMWYITNQKRSEEHTSELH